MLSGLKTPGGTYVAIINGMLNLNNPGTASAASNYWFYDTEIIGERSFSLVFEGNLDPGISGVEYVLVGTWFIIPEWTANTGGFMFVGILRKWTGSLYELDLGSNFPSSTTVTEVGYNINDGARKDTHIYALNYDISLSINSSGNVISVLNTQLFIDGVLQILANYGSTVDWKFYAPGIVTPLCPGVIFITAASAYANISMKRFETNARLINTSGDTYF